MIMFADEYLSRLRAVEHDATSRTLVRSKKRVAMGLAGSPERDPKIAHQFLLELFSFLAAIRSVKEYIAAAVARSAGKQTVRDKCLRTDIVVFHTEIANTVLHQNLIDNARTFYSGGPKSGNFAFNYVRDAMVGRAHTAYGNLLAEHQEKTGEALTVLRLADMVVDELKALHGQCKSRNYY